MPDFQTLKLAILFCLFTAQSSAQDSGYVYHNGTNWQPDFYNIIIESDPSAFKSVRLEVEKEAEMYDRDINNNQGGWINPISWIFKLSYNDEIESEIRMRKVDFSKEEAIDLANKYGAKMGQLPACLRKGVEKINILKSDALFGGNNYNNSIEITIGATSELYERTGNMEETLFHEATHAALDDLYQKDWQQHRDKDSKFISQYAFDYPNREDISESFILYSALNYRNKRLLASEKEKIESHIPNRLNYYKNLGLDMYPMTEKTIEPVQKAIDSFDPNAYYRLSTQWQGEGKSLDIINDGKNNQPILANTANVTGQMWKIKKVGTDTYTLSTKWQGASKVLDCIEGPNKHRPSLNEESGYSGGAWKITPVGSGYYRITNMWLSDRSLDIINDDEDNKIRVAKTGNYSGQFWKIVKVE